MNQLHGMLMQFSVMVGIPASNMPDKETMVVLVQALVRNFGTMHEAEVRKAFEMAATGELEAGEHFQTLSLKYISGVLNAFRVRVNQGMRQREREYIPAPTEQKEADWSETIEDLKKDPSLPIPAAIFDWLVQKGMIAPSHADKIEAMKQADAAYRAELNRKQLAGYITQDEKKELEQMQQQYGRKDAVYSKVANEAKRLMIRQYLTNQQTTTNEATA